MMRQEIGDNVFLTCVPSEKFKTSFLSAQLVVPLRRQTAGQGALLVNVLSRGTARCPDMAALGRELDMLYGAQLEPTVRKKGENQLVGFAASCIDDQYLPSGERLLEPLTDLLGEMLCAPALRCGHFNEDYFASERENLADLIRSEVNDKRVYASRRLMAVMCADEPYGISRLGTAQDAEAITLDALEEYYHTILPQARLELFYCGSASKKRATGAFQRALAALPRGPYLPLPPILHRNAPEQCRVVTEEMDVTQGKLCIGYRTSSSDAPASMMMNTMFGGGTSSKLFVNVREKMSLCYYADSVYHRKKGLITVSSGIGFDNYSRALETIAAQLDALRRGDWQDWEFQAAQNCLCSALRAIEDSPGALEDYLMGQAATDSAESIENLLSGIQSVTPGQIMEAAAAVRPDTVYFLKGKEGRL